jgi:hypothetical protein
MISRPSPRVELDVHLGSYGQVPPLNSLAQLRPIRSEPTFAPFRIATISGAK